MGITHAFTTAKVDGSDTTLLQPSYWNAEHVVSGIGLVPLESHTASSSATLNFTACISSTYDEYIVDFQAVEPATTGGELRLRISTDGGSNWDTNASNYVYSNLSVASTVTVVSATTSYVLMTPALYNGAGYFGVYGSVRVWPRTSRPHFVGQLGFLNSTPTRATMLVMGDYEPGAINALQFYMSNGNIALGTIRVYGVPK